MSRSMSCAEGQGMPSLRSPGASLDRRRHGFYLKCDQSSDQEMVVAPGYHRHYANVHAKITA